MKKPRVIVCQHGGRQRYMVARILEEAGMLASLYTDSSSLSPLGRVARPLNPLARGRLRRLLERKLDGIPKDKAFCSDRPLMSDMWASVFSSHESVLETHLRRHRILSRKMIKWGLQDANAVYSQSYENQDFVRYAKDKGLKVFVDININPLSNRILSRECHKYAGWKFRPLDNSIVERVEMLFRDSIVLADMILCPSEWVSEGVRDLCPEHAHKIRICPYSSSIAYNGRVNQPVRGRIFWAGGDVLRKGLPDLARAAAMLRPDYPEMEFRVAGSIDSKIRALPECRNLRFLGKLVRSKMKEEFLLADVFVLPTHSEGLAGVLLEAVVAGCPVITTRCAGMDIKDSENGIVVSPGDVDGIATAIQRVYSDRKFRDMLSSNTRELAADYTMDARKDRLISILREL